MPGRHRRSPALRPTSRAASVLLATLATVACGKLQPNPVGGGNVSGTTTTRTAGAPNERQLRAACASGATYARLKELAFDEAKRVQGGTSTNLDRLAAATTLRMEQPLVRSRDERLNVTVCTGRLILELPPGVERAFDGQRRLSADVEYAAHEAADGSGLVYQMDGAEPIVYRLAAFGPRGRPAVRTAEAPAAAPVPEPMTDAVEPTPPVAPAPPPPPVERIPPPPRTERPVARPAPVPLPPRPRAERPIERSVEVERRPVALARPSFNCRYARSRVETLICGSERLAAQDRRMASLFFARLAAAGPDSRRELQRTRGAFLRARDRCQSDGCVAASYDERIDELEQWNE